MKRVLKYILLFFAASTIIGCSKGQEFRGYIEYEVKAQKIDSNFTNDKFIKGFGDKSTFYYENGNYFQTHSNSMLEFGYLDHKAMQQGLKLADNDTLYLYDASKNEKEKLLNTEKSPLTQAILGYDCQRFDLYTQSLVYGFKQKFILYYSDKIKIDGRRFENIKLSFANEIYGKINSIPLSFEILNPIYSVEYTAVKIEKNDSISVSEMIKSNTKGLIIKRMN
jgi:hypothetical protein